MFCSECLRKTSTVKPRFWNNPLFWNTTFAFAADRNFYFINHLDFGFWNTLAAEQLVFQNRGFNVLCRDLRTDFRKNTKLMKIDILIFCPMCPVGYC